MAQQLANAPWDGLHVSCSAPEKSFRGTRNSLLNPRSAQSMISYAVEHFAGGPTLQERHVFPQNTPKTHCNASQLKLGQCHEVSSHHQSPDLGQTLSLQGLSIFWPLQPVNFISQAPVDQRLRLFAPASHLQVPTPKKCHPDALRQHLKTLTHVPQQRIQELVKREFKGWTCKPCKHLPEDFKDQFLGFLLCLAGHGAVQPPSGTAQTKTGARTQPTVEQQQKLLFGNLHLREQHSLCASPKCRFPSPSLCS